MQDLADYANQKWDAVIIGGGATGVGVLRDLAMRGVHALLLEKRDLANGTTSRFHGLLHSGARYAVSDAKAAQECIQENRILRAIGQHCVEKTEGFFVLAPEDRQTDPNFESKWQAACAQCGIETAQIPVSAALQMEPNLSPDILAVYRVPDAAIDGFRLVWQNVYSAQMHGSAFRTYTEVCGIQTEDGKVTGVEAVDSLSGEKAILRCSVVVNAGGSWAGQIAQFAGLQHIDLRPDRGTLVAFNHRFCSRVINRLHKAGDGDIFVPHGSITILGTTSKSAAKPDDFEPQQEEVLRLLDIGRTVFPHIDAYRILRTFAGTRPLYVPPEESAIAGRGVSRNFVILDHAHDGIAGLITICGGKLTTYRLMAEQTSDLVCEKLGVSTACRTACEPLVPDISPELYKRAAACFPAHGLEPAISRLGALLESAVEKIEKNPLKKTLLCECEMVTLAEFEIIAEASTTHTLNDIRRRTRMGMGTCQGVWCASRALAAMLRSDTLPQTLLHDFQQERWHGIKPVLWGQTLREMEFARGIYCATLNIDGEEYAGE